MHHGIRPVPQLSQGKALAVHGTEIREKQERAGWWVTDLSENCWWELSAFPYPSTNFRCELGWARLCSSAQDLCCYSRVRADRLQNQWCGCKLLRVRRIQSTVHYYINMTQHFQKYLLLSRYPSSQVFNHHLLTSLFLTKFVMFYQWWITLNLGCYHVWVRLYRFWSVAWGWQVWQTRPLFWQRCLFIFLSGLKLNACHRDVPLAVSERSWKLSNKKLQCHGFVLLMWLRKGTRHPGSKGFCPC